MVTSDLGQSVTFYRALLGHPPSAEGEERIFQAPATTSIHLHPGDADSPPTRLAIAIAAPTLDALDAAISRLNGAGIDHTVDRDGSAHTTDPDHNPITITPRPAQRE